MHNTFLNPKRQPTRIGLFDLLVRLKCSKYLRSTNSIQFVVPRIKTNSRSRAFFISGPAIWNTMSVPIHNTKTILQFQNLLKSHLFDLAFPPSSSSVARLLVDEPALASIMTHDHAKDLCAFKLGALRI